MKKVLALVLAAIMALSLVACSGSGTNTNTGDKDNGKKNYEIVMLMDNPGGSVEDGSFCQGTWDGIQRYCKEANVEATYFVPSEESKDAYLSNIEQAVNVGAKVVVCPGFLFEEAIFDAQKTYPDVKFILIDGRPHNADYTVYETGKNTYSILFAEQEVGFLAGYAAVMEGYKNLAFFGGMAVTSVARYGYGYVEGADYAAKKLGLKKGDINMIYWYSGDFIPSPEKLTTVKGWYQTGTDVIFSCGGTICQNAFAAAEELGKATIGVDIDQAKDSKTCITSAMKGLSNATYDALLGYKDGKFPGGVDATLGTAEDCVGLPTDKDSWRFQNFTVDQYNEIYNALKNDENKLASSLLTDADIQDPTQIPVEIVKLDYKN